MANRFWVGGTGSWDGTIGLKWALTSGGVGGQTVPTSADTVFFDANSGASTVTIGAGTSICSTLTMTGFTGTLAFGSNSITIASNGTNVFLGATTYSVTGTPLINLTYSGSAGISVAPASVTEANSISFNISAGSYSFTIGGAIKNLTFSGTYTGNLVSSSRTIYGNLTFKTGMTVGAGGNTTTFAATSGTQTITSAGLNLDFPITLGISLATTAATGNGTTATLTFVAQTILPFAVGGTIVVAGVVPAGYNGTYTVTAVTSTTVSYANATTGAQTTAGGVGTTNTVQLQDALTLGSTRSLVHSSGTFDLNDKTVTTGLFSHGPASVRTMAFGTASVNITGNNTNVWVTNSSSVTILTGTKTVNLTYSGATGTRAVLTGSNAQILNRFSFNVTAGSDTVNFQNLINNLDFTGFSGTWQNQLLTINGNLTVSSGMSIASGANTVNFYNWGGLQEIISAGKNFNFPFSTGLGANTTGASGTGTTATLTFSALNAFPPVGSTVVINGVVPAGYNGTYVVTASSTTSVSYANATTGAQTASGSILTSGTVRLLDDLSVGTSTTRVITLTSGTLDLNNKSLTNFGSFSSSSTSPRAIAFGTTGNYTNTYNLGTSTIFNIAIATNFSITGTPTINVSGNATTGTRRLDYGNTNAPASPEANSLSFYITAGSDTVQITGTSYTRNLDFTGSFTGTLSNSTRSIYGNYTLNPNMTIAGSNLTTSFLATSGTQVITSFGKFLDFNITMAGTTTYQLVGSLNNTGRTLALTSGTLDLNNNDVTTGFFVGTGSTTRTIAFGTGQFYLPSLTGNIWNVTGTNLTITGASSTVNATANATTGERTIVHVPTTVSQALSINLNVTAGSSNFGFGTGQQLFNNLNFTGFSGAIGNSGLSGNARFTIYGNLTMGAGMTCIGGNSSHDFRGTGTQLITSNGVSFDQQINCNGTGTVSLQDAFVTGATRAISFNTGTLQTNGYNVTCGTFSFFNSNTKTLNISNSVVTVLGGTSTTGFTGSTTGTTYNLTNAEIIFTTSGTAVLNGLGSGATNTSLTTTMGGTGTLNFGSASQGTVIGTLRNTVQPCTISLLSTAGTLTLTNFNLSGTAGNLVTLNSTVAGTQANIRKTSGTVNAQYLYIQDSFADGGAVWNAINSTNAGNNTGWNFLTTNSGNFFMMF